MASSESNTELMQLEHSHEAGTHSGRDLQSLPRADGGKDAWLFLLAVFMFESIIWGFPFTFGVFQKYYASHEPFASEASGIPAIGSTALGLMYFPAPITAFVLQRYPQLRRPCMVFGVLILVAALVAASFCRNVVALIATQGAMYAFGGLLAYFPAMQLIDEWFVQRKGLAFACVWAGGPVAGCVLPWVMQWLLDDYGYETALRAWAITVALILGPSIFLIKPRLPVTRASAVRPHDYTFFKRPRFWWYLTGSIMQSFGFFLPSLWIPTFAADFGFPSFAGPLALALYNIAACFGAIIQGSLVDHFHVTFDLLVATVVSMIAVFVFWGLADSQPMLYVFALIWGMSGGAYNATWAGYALDIRSHGHPNLDASFIISLIAMGKGFSAVVSGPLSEKLLQSNPWKHANFAYGSQYGLMIVFTGVCVTLGGSAWFGRALRLI